MEFRFKDYIYLISMIAGAIIVLVLATTVLSHKDHIFLISMIASTIIISVLAIIVLGPKTLLGKNQEEKTKGSQTVDDLIGQEGEPDSILTTDPTRGNEPDGVVLIYRQGGKDGRGYLVHGSHKIDIADVKDITMKNAAQPYLPNDYMLFIAIDRVIRPIRIAVGSDSSTAMELCNTLKEACGMET